MMRAADRLLALEETLAELIELNETMPVIVEGLRDMAALRRLGLSGEILRVNGGIPLLQLCDQLAERYADVVILTDWDRTGGAILRKFRDNLEGRVRLHAELRRNLAVHSEVRDVESLPAYLEGLRARERVEASREAGRETAP